MLFPTRLLRNTKNILRAMSKKNLLLYTKIFSLLLLFSLTVAASSCKPAFESDKTLTIKLGNNENLVLSDYYITASCTLDENEKRITYKGDMTDKEIMTELWDIICSYNNAEPFNGGVGNADDYYLSFKNRKNNFSFSVSTVILEIPSTDGIDAGGEFDVAAGIIIRSGDSYVQYCSDWKTYNRFNELVVASCENSENIVEEKELPKVIYGVDKDMIVLINRQINFSSGYYERGNFIDTYGDVYSYEFTGEAPETDEAFLEKLYYDVYYTTEPVYSTDPQMIMLCYEKFYDISPNAKMHEEASGSADMGQDILYVSDGLSLIKITSFGDWNRTLEDDTAKEIIEIYKALDYAKY